MQEIDYKQLNRECNSIWMSGRLVIESKEGTLLIRKRYYPLFVAIWTLLVCGSVAYFVVTQSRDKSFNLMFLLISGVMPMVFIGLAAYLDRRPAVLNWHSRARELSVGGERFICPTDKLLTIAIGDVDFKRGNQTIDGEAIYIRSAESGQLHAIYVEHGRPSLREKFEKLKGAEGFRVISAPSANLI
jgi:hypothetical protein